MKLYHIVPEEMIGTTLMPLATLEQIAPALGRQERAKYAGREHIAAMAIPCLACTWLQVLHMFAVPLDVVRRRQELLMSRPLRFFEIEIHKLNPNHLAVWYRDDEQTGHMVFDPFDTSLPVDCPDEEHEQWFRDEYAAGRPLPLFAAIPHILYKGNIDISRCSIVS